MSTEATGIYWVVPPEKLAAAFSRYGLAVVEAVVELAKYFAIRMQGEARMNAPWQDRTGNARSGLFGEVEFEAARQVVTIYLSHGHTINYGLFLELAHGQRFAIIGPTIQANLPELKVMLDRIFETVRVV